MSDDNDNEEKPDRWPPPDPATKCTDCGCYNHLHFPWCKHHGGGR